MTTIVYSDKYFANIGPHVFPAQKYRLTYEMLEKDGHLKSPHVKLLQPRMPTRDELMLVHENKYLDDVLNYRITPATFSSELPMKREVVEAFLLSSGGTLVAAESAVSAGRSINLGGGFHHAFPDHAEGFCFFNDVAMACRALLKEKKAARIAVVDCDLHQGNGTAYIFRDEPNVFTFSIHQENNYPIKQKSDLDIGLDDGVGDEEYLAKLGGAIERIQKEFKPDFVFYLAGADPFEDDQLGSLELTHEGFKRREDMVIGTFCDAKVPVCVVLAGGYSRDVWDTVKIHYSTCVRLFAEDKG
ncbi:MAG: histone deacetylase [Candidatus Lindowbacteria bacterium]|nr:histone deacetylase [Candidatus Lindowbacteria bacterium]